MYDDHTHNYHDCIYIYREPYLLRYDAHIHCTYRKHHTEETKKNRIIKLKILFPQRRQECGETHSEEHVPRSCTVTHHVYTANHDANVLRCKCTVPQTNIIPIQLYRAAQILICNA